MKRIAFALLVAGSLMSSLPARAGAVLAQCSGTMRTSIDSKWMSFTPSCGSSFVLETPTAIDVALHGGPDTTGEVTACLRMYEVGYERCSRQVFAGGVPLGVPVELGDTDPVPAGRTHLFVFGGGQVRGLPYSHPGSPFLCVPPYWKSWICVPYAYAHVTYGIGTFGATATVADPA